MTAVAVGTTGSHTVTGAELRAALGLPDDRVWINSDRIVKGGIRTAYDALKCAPGLPTSPQTAVPGGAEQHFRTGGLYRNGHRNVTVWLRGAVDDEYRAVGSGGGVLGVPVSHVLVLGTTSNRAVACTGSRASEPTRSGDRSSRPISEPEGRQARWASRRPASCRVSAVASEPCSSAVAWCVPPASPARSYRASSRRRACLRVRCWCMRTSPRTPVTTSRPAVR